MVSTELDKQSVPSDSSCPYCGSAPTDESQVEHRLSNIGYLHDDIQLRCSECDQSWICGVPIGEYDGERADELFCDSCETRYMRVHRVELHREGDDEVVIHLKCPNQDCLHFDKIVRQPGERGVVLMGYPDITGEVEGAEAYGYND